MSNSETFLKRIDDNKTSESAKLSRINQIKWEYSESMLASLILGMEELNEVAQLSGDKQKWFDIQGIENLSEEAQLAAVQKHWLDIQYIKNPSEAVQLAAIQKKLMTIPRIKLYMKILLYKMWLSKYRKHRGLHN